MHERINAYGQAFISLITYIYFSMNNWVHLATFTLPHEAYMAQNLLEAEGLETFLRDELSVQVDNFISQAIGGVKIMVKEEHGQKALEILREGGYIDPPKEPKIKHVKLTEETNKKECPFCGSDNINRNREPNLFTILGMFLVGAFFPVYRKSYLCFDCKKRWKWID